MDDAIITCPKCKEPEAIEIEIRMDIELTDIEATAYPCGFCGFEMDEDHTMLAACDAIDRAEVDWVCLTVGYMVNHYRAQAEMSIDYAAWKAAAAQKAAA